MIVSFPACAGWFVTLSHRDEYHNAGNFYRKDCHYVCILLFK